MYRFYIFFPFYITSSVTSLVPSCFVIVVFLVVTVLPLTVFVVVLTDFEVPAEPPKLVDDDEKLLPKPLLKKSSLSPKNEENPPNPPKPPDLPFFLRLKKLLNKSSSSWSNWLVEKNLAKISSAWLKSKWLKAADLGPLKP